MSEVYIVIVRFDCEGGYIKGVYDNYADAELRVIELLSDSNTYDSVEYHLVAIGQSVEISV